jgi:hypothetical protein
MATFGVHSIMMVNSAQRGEGEGCTRIPPFTLSTISTRVATPLHRVERQRRHSTTAGGKTGFEWNLITT